MNFYYKKEIARTSENKEQYCNICGEKLDIIYGYKKNTIKKCSNDYCESLKKIKRRWFAFYDFDKFQIKIKNNLEKIKNIKSQWNKDFWIERGYTEEEAIKKVHDIQTLNAKKVKNIKSQWNKNFWIERGYTEEEAIEKISSIQKKNSCRNIEHWLKGGYTEEEAIKKVSDLQKEYGKKSNLNGRNHPIDIEYWEKIINDKETAFELWKSFCKEKYSITPEKIGIEKYNNMIRNRKETYNSRTDDDKLKINKSKGRTFEQLVKEKGINMALEIIKSRTFKNKFYSNISKELFDNLSKSINEKCYYAENEWFIKHNKGVYYVDFKMNNKIIEFFGTVYHADKRFYKNEDTPNPFNDLTSETIWLKDKERIDTIKKKGYDVLIIWEYDYLKDKEKILNKCKEFLQIN